MAYTDQEIRVDFDSLDRFAVAVEDDVNRTFRPAVQRAVSRIEGADGAIGGDPRFEEAALVQRQGQTTTASARAFLDLLGEHVCVMVADVQRARRQYEDCDLSAAEQVNLERAQWWSSTLAAPGMPGNIFVADGHQADGPGRRMDGDGCD
ncbi:MAG: hypothetical protein ACRCYX_02825 [Dermatophilaceae bacterium]